MSLTAEYSRDRERWRGGDREQKKYHTVPLVHCHLHISVKRNLNRILNGIFIEIFASDHCVLTSLFGAYSFLLLYSYIPRIFKLGFLVDLISIASVLVDGGGWRVYRWKNMNNEAKNMSSLYRRCMLTYFVWVWWPRAVKWNNNEFHRKKSFKSRSDPTDECLSSPIAACANEFMEKRNWNEKS